MSLEEVGIEVLLSGASSGGQLAVIEEVVESDFDGPPLHLHPSFDEGFYVLQGELTLRVGDDLLTAGPGTFAFAARGTPHTFANLSGESARVLIICTPAGFERYFERLAAQRAGVEPAPWASEAAPETVRVGPRIRDERPAVADDE
jgi:mannose-6-phosphate isomerase-like protein (cupin superfamily)